MKTYASKIALLLFISANILCAQVLSLDASKWRLRWDDTAPQPYNIGPVLAFDFCNELIQPGLDDGYLMYQLSPSTSKKSVVNLNGKTITITLRVVADPNTTFECFEPGCREPTFRAFVYTTQKGGNDRWWANPISYALTNGTVTMVIPVTPSQWSNVNGIVGTSTPAAFTQSMATVQFVGGTFGCCFFGHGVHSIGYARMEILEYRID